jgi:hypothetical protein
VVSDDGTPVTGAFGGPGVVPGAPA